MIYGRYLEAVLLRSGPTIYGISKITVHEEITSELV